ncbi:hypothetical protein [Labrys miyagiensis]|uniref:hypothetical protein n=1 Tax=Labrys miyagiensis TaxID=346912 RepID=UPI0024E17C0E|nr:hypothetical protein [Labrys miyagiensis]
MLSTTALDLEKSRFVGMVGNVICGLAVAQSRFAPARHYIQTLTKYKHTIYTHETQWKKKELLLLKVLRNVGEAFSRLQVSFQFSLWQL